MPKQAPRRAALSGPVVSEDLGAGPPVMLLHGLAGSSRWWSRNIGALSRSFRVINIDLPGFGTSRSGEGIALDDIAGQLVATMDRLMLSRASVIGHSMGGLIAAGLASDHPERVDRLILVDAALLSLDPAGVRQVTGMAITVRWTAPSLIPALISDGLRSGPGRLTDAAIQLMRAKLPRIQAPTLVIWGEHDEICPLTIGRRIVASIPGSRLVIVEGAAHNPMWEQSAVFDREVLDFLVVKAGQQA
jgi:pimeloyl-ACP methyl ester carboxylesterase